MRYFFEISYKGTKYHGWQSQKNAIGIQEVVLKALATILQEDISIVGSGRTDTGVHCKQQFFHTDIQKKFKKDWLQHRINSFLPPDIAIHSINTVKPEAHARFDAISRGYEYFITLTKDPFLIDGAYFYRKKLNIPTMNDAASLLIGKQNFESFSKVKTDVSNFVCEITEAEWREKDGLLIFYISANRFLRGMVRAIVGTLLEIGKGNLSKEELGHIISSQNRKEAGAAAPAHGLYLTRVQYPEDIFIKN